MPAAPNRVPHGAPVVPHAFTGTLHSFAGTPSFATAMPNITAPIESGAGTSSEPRGNPFGPSVFHSVPTAPHGSPFHGLTWHGFGSVQDHG